jgi:hypothetical protein
MWEKNEAAETGMVYTSDLAEGYKIHERFGDFYVHRVAANCDDIGPLPTFKHAEDIIMKIQITLLQLEDKLWEVSAAMALKEHGKETAQ